ncbi:MAG: hypothetical protein HQM08_24430 [Candidatus Riflebacteria bacterium]|nr:hypothetical protein [Candidatus Riflebacteria bacterium]
MESLIVLLIIIFSVLSELGKKKDDIPAEGKSDPLSELKKIEDFLRNQGKAPPNPEQTPKDIFSDVARTGKSSSSGRKNGKKQIKQIPPPPQIETQTVFTEKEEAPPQEKPIFTDNSNPNVVKLKASLETPKAKFKFTKQSLINGIVFQELMNRYDFSRIYSRIPGRREE